jgi:lysine-specific demethylase 8
MSWLGPQPALSPVARLARVDEAAFARDWLDQRPLVITDLATAWGAIGRWTPAHLRAVAGHVRVTVRRYERDDDVPFIEQTAQHTAKTTLSTWIDFIEGDGDGEFEGAPTSWSLRESQEVWRFCPQLLPDLPFGRAFPGLATRFERFLWLGPPGYVTGLHVDVVELNLLCQIHGAKDVVLFSPSENERLYAEARTVQDGLYSHVNSYAPDLARHPRFAEAKGQHTTLRPGEILYIPNGWWHATRSAGVTISVNGSCRRLPRPALSPVDEHR